MSGSKQLICFQNSFARLKRRCIEREGLSRQGLQIDLSALLLNVLARENEKWRARPVNVLVTLATIQHRSIRPNNPQVELMAARTANFA